MRFVPVLALFALSVPAFAQETPAPAPQTAKPGKNDPNRMVCRSVATTGSILGGRKECHTKAEWDNAAEKDQREFRQAAGNSGHSPGQR
ncbi:hypothetical protein [Sphingomonas sp. KR3-1]|uniref:hypothetical protein n=1 Tax=Sphingomonas sp. KR3-1 TaxID=3156611 RepID=UPI0032B5A050